MKSLQEIYRKNGQDASLARKEGHFEQRPYGRIYIPPCFNGTQPKAKDPIKPDCLNEISKGVRYIFFSPYLH